MVTALVVGCVRTLESQAFAQTATSKEDQSEADFKSIFDGTLDGWSGDAELWRVEDGVIIGESTAEAPLQRNQFLIWRQGEVDDFELRFQYKISGTKRANSGVQIRSFLADNGHLCGYQADIARTPGISGSLYSEQTGRSVLCPLGKSRNLAAEAKEPVALADFDAATKAQKLDDWNEMSIVASGSKITITVNGVLTSQFNDAADKLNEQGLLGLQLHAGPPMKIEFKDIRMRRLKLHK